MESKLNTYRSWLDFLQTVESYFKNKAYLKVCTPTLVASGAMESSLHPYKIEGKSLQLPTSPEFSLKKLWLSGFSPTIFEVSPSFRAEELGGMHLDEFTMLEFYDAKSSFQELIHITNDFLCSTLNIEPHVLKVLNVNEIFEAFVGFKLEPSSDVMFLKKALDFHGIVFPKNASWSDLYHILYLEKIEPSLNFDLIALKNYPPQLSALAKINSDGWSDRVEFYYRGVELGNGYDELLDADEILVRWKAENELRASEGLTPHPLDLEFIELHRARKIESGVGMAIGLERLFWLTRRSPPKHIKVWPFGGDQ